MLKIAHWLDNRLTDGSEVVSLTSRPRSSQQKHYFSAYRTHFCKRPSKFIHLIGARTSDLPACSIVLEQYATACPHLQLVLRSIMRGSVYRLLHASSWGTVSLVKHKSNLNSFAQHLPSKGPHGKNWIHFFNIIFSLGTEHTWTSDLYFLLNEAICLIYKKK
jgi:hypothetical protein